MSRVFLNHFKSTLLIFIVFAVVVSCSDNSMNEEFELEGIASEFVEEVDFLTNNNSMIVTPNNHQVEQTIVFTPRGKEMDLLTKLGLKTDNYIHSEEECGLSKMGAAKLVAKITDDGDCAQVRKEKRGKYCVKQIECQ